MAPPGWQLYQARAAAVFERLGCSVAVDAAVEGARSTHKVDVAVRFSGWGLPQLWIVECKYLKRRVTKASVETLKSIVDDVGANKGFILSEVGFQPGAISAANITSISLLSIADLQEAVAPDVQRLLLAQLEAESLALREALLALQTTSRQGRETVVRGKPGVHGHHLMSGLGALLFLLEAINGAKLHKYPMTIPRSPTSGIDEYVRISDLASLINEGGNLVSEMRSWERRQAQRVKRAQRLLAVLRREDAL